MCLFLSSTSTLYMLGYLFLTSFISFFMTFCVGTFARSNCIPFLNISPLAKSTTKFHFSFHVSAFENFRSVMSMSWSMSAIFASTSFAAFIAVSISEPGITPVLAPSFFSVHVPISANSHPFTPTLFMSLMLSLAFCLCSRA